MVRVHSIRTCSYTVSSKTQCAVSNGSWSKETYMHIKEVLHQEKEINTLQLSLLLRSTEAKTWTLSCVLQNTVLLHALVEV